MTTKERILEESMKLFSTYGYDAVTVRMIGAAVGIGNSALYKHFKNKQEVFDTLVECSKRIFQEKFQSMNYTQLNLEGFRSMCLEMFRFQTEEPWIVMFRKILCMGQFKSLELAAVYQELFIHQPLVCQSTIFTELMKQGFMKKRDPYVLAMELYAPFFLYHTSEEKQDVLYERFQKHIDYFIENNELKELLRNEENDGRTNFKQKISQR